jgi:hypothetical protein
MAASRSQPSSEPRHVFPLLLTVAMTALIVWALISVARPRPAFVIQIEAGVPRVARGTVAQAFVAEVADACRRHRVQTGTVTGVVSDRRIALAFSGDISTTCGQQLRNLWSMSGWSVVPKSG